MSKQARAPGAAKYMALEIMVGAYLLAAGIASFLATGSVWPLLLIVLGALGGAFAICAWVAVVYEEGAQAARDAACSVAGATTLGLVLTAALCALHISLGLAPLAERETAVRVYGGIASALPCAYFIGAVAHHYAFYAGRAQFLQRGQAALDGVAAYGAAAKAALAAFPAEATHCAWAWLVQFCVLAASYVVFFLPAETWWLEAVFLCICFFSYLGFALFGPRDPAAWRVPAPFACVVSLWQAACIGMLLFLGMASTTLLLTTHFDMPARAAARSEAALCYGIVATLLPALGFQTAMLWHTQFCAGYAAAYDELVFDDAAPAEL